MTTPPIPPIQGDLKPYFVALAEFCAGRPLSKLREILLAEFEKFRQRGPVELTDFVEYSIVHFGLPTTWLPNYYDLDTDERQRQLIWKRMSTESRLFAARPEDWPFWLLTDRPRLLARQEELRRYHAYQQQRQLASVEQADPGQAERAAAQAAEYAERLARLDHALANLSEAPPATAPEEPARPRTMADLTKAIRERDPRWPQSLFDTFSPATPPNTGLVSTVVLADVAPGAANGEQVPPAYELGDFLADAPDDLIPYLKANYSNARPAAIAAMLAALAELGLFNMKENQTHLTAALNNTLGCTFPRQSLREAMLVIEKNKSQTVRRIQAEKAKITEAVNK